MKKIIIPIVFVFVSLVSVGFISYNAPLYTNIPSNAAGVGSVINAARFSDWIGGVTPAINVFVKPADSPNFVGDNTSGTFDRQDFFRWSEQMFLWILSPASTAIPSGSCKGLVLNSPEFFDYRDGVYLRHHCTDPIAPDMKMSNNKDITNVGDNMTFEVKGVTKGKNNLPLFFERGTNKMFEVDKTPKSKNGYQLVKDTKGNVVEVSDIKISKNRPVFYDLKGKPIEKATLIMTKGLENETTVQQFITANKIILNVAIPYDPIVILSDQSQANLGGTGKVLMAKNGSLVYYNIMVNDIFAVFSTMVHNGDLPSDTLFPTTVDELNVIKDYAAAHNIPIIDTGNRVLAMELKTSWVENIDLPNGGADYVKISTVIPNYIHTSTGVWTRSGTRTAVLALVGMHVVGSALGHPEMIWGTFEHINNTPNQSYSYTTNTGGIASVPTDTNLADFLFSTANATSFNVPFIITSSTGLTSTTGHTISPSNTKRMQPFGWGGLIGQQSSNNNPDILSVTNSNAQLVAVNYDANSRLIIGDVRKKYFQVGSTWRSLIVQGAEAGTIKLSNSTMETYTQSSTNNILGTDTGLNCFSCHQSNSESPAPALMNLSHVFGGTLVP